MVFKSLLKANIKADIVLVVLSGFVLTHQLEISHFKIALLKKILLLKYL